VIYRLLALLRHRGVSPIESGNRTYSSAPTAALSIVIQVLGRM